MVCDYSCVKYVISIVWDCQVVVCATEIHTHWWAPIYPPLPFLSVLCALGVWAKKRKKCLQAFLSRWPPKVRGQLSTNFPQPANRVFFLLIEALTMRMKLRVTSYRRFLKFTSNLQSSLHWLTSFRPWSLYGFFFYSCMFYIRIIIC